MADFIEAAMKLDAKFPGTFEQAVGFLNNMAGPENFEKSRAFASHVLTEACKDDVVVIDNDESWDFVVPKMTAMWLKEFTDEFDVCF